MLENITTYLASHSLAGPFDSHFYLILCARRMHMVSHSQNIRERSAKVPLDLPPSQADTLFVRVARPWAEPSDISTPDILCPSIFLVTSL